MEDGVTVTGEAGAVAPRLEPGSLQQNQVEEEQSPDDVDEPVQRLPVPAELALRPRVAGDQQRDEQRHHHEAHELEDVPAQASEEASREGIGETGGESVAERAERHHDPVPAP